MTGLYEQPGVVLYQAAIDTARDGRYNEALEQAREYERWAKEQGEGVAKEHYLERANLLVGTLLARMGYYEQAQQRLREALDVQDIADVVDAMMAYVELVHTAEEGEPLRPILDRTMHALEAETGADAERLRALCRYVDGRLLYYEKDAHAASPIYAELVESPHITARDRVYVRIQHARTLRFTHGPFDAEEECRQALADAEDLGELRLIALARRRIAQFQLDAGKHDESRKELLRTVKELDGTGLHGELADVCNALGELERYQGSPDTARSWYQRAVAIWDKLGSLSSSGYPRFNLLYLILDEGKSEGAHEHMEALETWAKAQSLPIQRLVELQRIRLAFIEGRYRETIDRLKAFFEQSKEVHELDDALTLEWLVERYMELPRKRRDAESVLVAADCLSVAQRLWESMERPSDVDRVRELRRRLRALVATEMSGAHAAINTDKFPAK